MASFQPIPIDPDDPFDTALLQENFSRLRTALNPRTQGSVVTGIGDYASGNKNILNDYKSLNAANFRPGALTETFTSVVPGTMGGTGLHASFLYIRAGTEDPPITSWRDYYDVPGSGVRGFAKADATALVMFSLQISNVKSGAAFNTSSSTWERAVLMVTAHLNHISGYGAPTEVATSRTYFPMFEDASPPEIGHPYAGMEVSIVHAMPIEEGSFELYVNADFNLLDLQRGTTNTIWDGLGIKGRGGATTVTLIYH